MESGEVMLEDFSDGQAFRFTGSTARTFPNPPSPRRLIVDRHNNLEFERIEAHGGWSKWALFWHQEPPVDVRLWERESTGPRTGVVSPILTNDDGSEVSTRYRKIPRPGDDLMHYIGRGWHRGTTFDAPRAGVDIGTGQHLAIKTVSYPFEIEDRRSLLGRIGRSCKLSHPHLIAFLQVKPTRIGIDIITPLKHGNLLWFIQNHRNNLEMLRTPTESDQLGQLLFGQILGQMLSALDYLESQDVVHRFIRPGNILVKAGLSEGGNHSFYLSNFQYESLSGTTFEPSDVCSKAPEECGLTNAQVSTQTDIWGLCATMVYVFDLSGFRDLVGRRPSNFVLAHAVRERSRMLASLQGMGEWDANHRPSARQRLVEAFGEGVLGTQ
ncbi:hypothetical protein CEP54_012292 [Fusarium duplospermum]|uniref:Protein kinase domain-containing protein n=1 Tax=Fusarium duplospermum TaxID=1325734 RepID=A0A428P9F8_9HYPO|nr:hypothetical protein CEP54_012292 [Fusarium duplospermum]